MVNAADLFPVGYLASVNLPHLIRTQIPDWILGIDDEHQRVDGQRLGYDLIPTSLADFNSFLEISRLAIIMSVLDSIRFSYAP